MNLQELFEAFDASETVTNGVKGLSQVTSNLAYRSVYTSVLGGLVNDLVREYHNDIKGVSEDPLSDPKLKGLSSLDLLAEFEMQERESEVGFQSFNGYETVDVKLNTDQKYIILSVAEVQAKRTADPLDRFQRPMELGAWLRFILRSTGSNQAARDQLIETITSEFGFSNPEDRINIEAMSQASIANERQKINDAIPSILKRYKELRNIYPRVGGIEDLALANLNKQGVYGEDSDVEAYHAYAFATKVTNKAIEAVDKTVNQAIRFNKIELLGSARLIKEDLRYLVKLQQDAEAGAEAVLEILQDFDLPKLNTTGLRRHLK